MALRLAWATVWVPVSNFSYINSERREETENIEGFSSYNRKCFNTTRLSVVSSKSFPYTSVTYREDTLCWVVLCQLDTSYSPWRGQSLS